MDDVIQYRLHRRRVNLFGCRVDAGPHRVGVPSKWPTGVKQVWHATSPATGALIGAGRSKAAARADLERFHPVR